MRVENKLKNRKTSFSWWSSLVDSILADTKEMILVQVAITYPILFYFEFQWLVFKYISTYLFGCIFCSDYIAPRSPHTPSRKLDGSDQYPGSGERGLKPISFAQLDRPSTPLLEDGARSPFEEGPPRPPLPNNMDHGTWNHVILRHTNYAPYIGTCPSVLKYNTCSVYRQKDPLVHHLQAKI